MPRSPASCFVTPRLDSHLRGINIPSPYVYYPERRGCFHLKKETIPHSCPAKETTDVTVASAVDTFLLCVTSSQFSNKLCNPIREN